MGFASDADVEALVRLIARQQLPSWGIPTSIGMVKRGERLPCQGVAGIPRCASGCRMVR